MTVSITTSEGNLITGETALDVVRQMNARALIGESDAWRYMQSLALRVQRLSGRSIRTSSPMQFLEDLDMAGFINLDEAAVAEREPGQGLRRAEETHGSV